MVRQVAQPLRLPRPDSSGGLCLPDSMTVAELNSLDLPAFLAAAGWGSPWVAERAWPQRPFVTLEALHAAMVDAVACASPAEQLALIRAHPDPMTIAQLNSLDLPAFLAAVGWVFEHSPWVAERAWPQRPFATLQALHKAMVDAVARASPVEQLALIRAHPDLGARARMSAVSEGEQAGAGLDRLSAAEFDRLTRLNAAYREKFGFPFIFAVKGAPKHDILAALEARLAAGPESERPAALGQIYRIAQFRLESVISCTTS